MFRLEDGIAALQTGELVVYPTETFYAIGADAFSSIALRRLFEVKGREPGRPVGLIAADIAMAFSVAREIPIDARRLADAFWPGPLTLVLPARDSIAPELAGPDGVGVRVSPNPVARALSAGIGRPITATSANLSGEAPASTLEEARSGLGGKVKVYLEGGKLMASAPSTVVAFNQTGWKMVRLGAISERQIAIALAGDALK
ncbi:L-threonylcarbamoyladenylate synthase [Candidatus Binatus sp.]|uniref:L-threonylcarbamoyladenylate synthase n=1 Tax=Candidatus Binatus sp. TaxID=2811406 RepID=UPI003BAE3C32